MAHRWIGTLSIAALGSVLLSLVGGASSGEEKPSGSQESASVSWQPPDPPAARERKTERRRMVRNQIVDPPFGRPAVEAEHVLEAMRTVPRHAFVPSDVRARAYADTALPIGHGQTISQPYIVAMMTEKLRLTENSEVLEIGTGSGYQAAVLGQLTPHVYTIEILEPLAREAAKTLKAQGYDHVETKAGDGYFGWEAHAPFDAIIVTAAAEHVPPPLWRQLKAGGRMIIPIGGAYQVQRLVLLKKTEEGGRKTKSLMTVRFVPMTGAIEER